MQGTRRARTSCPTLLLPRSLVLAAVLVVVTGARVALASSHATPLGALAAITTTWILSGRGNIAAAHSILRRQHPEQSACLLGVTEPRESSAFGPGAHC